MSDSIPEPDNIIFKPCFKMFLLALKSLSCFSPHDLIKDNFCKDNNINLLRISYKEKIEEKLNFLFNI